MISGKGERSPLAGKRVSLRVAEVVGFGCCEREEEGLKVVGYEEQGNFSVEARVWAAVYCERDFLGRRVFCEENGQG